MVPPVLLRRIFFEEPSELAQDLRIVVTAFLVGVQHVLGGNYGEAVRVGVSQLAHVCAEVREEAGLVNLPVSALQFSTIQRSTIVQSTILPSTVLLITTMLNKALLGAMLPNAIVPLAHFPV